MVVKISISNYSSDSAKTIYTGQPVTIVATCNTCGHVEKMLEVTEVKGGAKCPACESGGVSIKIEKL